MSLIKLTGNRYSIDWVYDENKEIETNDIFGFELHWRGDSWHIVVRTKEKCSDGYYYYEIGHWVDKREAKRLLSIKEAKILKIINYHSSNNFTEALLELTKGVQ